MCNDIEMSRCSHLPVTLVLLRVIRIVAVLMVGLGKCITILGIVFTGDVIHILDWKVNFQILLFSRVAYVYF